LLGGVGVVEVAVGTVAAAVLIRRNTESSHFGFLHAGTGRNRGCSDEHWAPFVLGCAPARAAASVVSAPVSGNVTQTPSVGFSRLTKIVKQKQKPTIGRKNNFN